MRLPRDLGGADLVKALARLGYQISRQTGSHIRLTHSGSPEHHLTVPSHSPLNIGTLSVILSEVASHLGLTREQLLDRLF